MRILSYRGPSAAGGVSNALTQIFDKFEQGSEWWFIRDSCLFRKHGTVEKECFLLDDELRINHYRYCNNFLWPIFHDMPSLAKFSEIERRDYRAFNVGVAFRLRIAPVVDDDGCFVNDYQFALVPRLLKASSDSFVFWHIPWPKAVREEHVPYVSELAIGLLHSNVVGFHTEEYLRNFFDFVERHLPQYKVDFRAQVISNLDRNNFQSPRTRCIAAPLGIDVSHWNELSRLGCLIPVASPAFEAPYILSVDRADYTKGVRERLIAVDRFFREYPEYQKKVTFLQVCVKSREGLPQFDSYRSQCMDLLDELNARWGDTGWRPVRWLGEPQSGPELATLYRKAAVMLVNPLRDGLNLTAKEFVACQHGLPGVLALSRGAGVWHELGRDCMAIQPEDPEKFADTIVNCLQMGAGEKLRRSHSLKKQLLSNSLASWWQILRESYHSTRSSEILEKVCS